MSILLRGGPVLTGRTGTTPDPDRPLAVVVEGDRIAWVGSEADAAAHVAGVDRVVDLAGALLAPAFVDAHVHLSHTGATLRGVDLAAAPSLAAALALVKSGARRSRGRPLYASGWDETGWPEGRPPTAAELDRASWGGVVYAPRVDGHSAVLSSSLAAASGAAAHDGWAGEGRVERAAHHAARDHFAAAVTPAQRRDDIDLALHAAAEAGIAMVTECAGPTVSSAQDLADVLAAGERGSVPRTTGYWAQLVADEQEARSVAALHGVGGLGGDLNVDGSIGSRTASLREPYVDAPGHTGYPYLSVAQVRDHVAACVLAGLQCGFHVIGDAGADTVVEGIVAAAGLAGEDTVRAARVRLEHLEMVSPEGSRALGRLGVTASVQPAFDAAWGGATGMYAARLGPDRVRGMNAFAELAADGVHLALGSDSPVTPFAPWAALAACTDHHEPAHRLPLGRAFAAHTTGGWWAAGTDVRAEVAVGAPATLAVWDTGGATSVADLDPRRVVPRALLTLDSGRVLHDAGVL